MNGEKDAIPNPNPHRSDLTGGFGSLSHPVQAPQVFRLDSGGKKAPELDAMCVRSGLSKIGVKDLLSALPRLNPADDRNTHADGTLSHY